MMSDYTDIWSEWPMNDEVNWPKNEAIIGVLGVAPIATADFFVKLSNRATKKDWEHPRVIIDSNPKIPSRGRYFELGETNPVPYIRSGIMELASRGATIIAVPCNTIHILYNEYMCGVPVATPNIVDVTSLSIARQGFMRPVLLASTSTVKSKIYQNSLARYGVVLRKFEDQDLVTSGINAVKQNAALQDIAALIKKDIERMPEVDSIILGCTELAILMIESEMNIPMVDSNQALADFVYDFAKNCVLPDDRVRVNALARNG